MTKKINSKRIIKDYRAKTSVTFWCKDGKVNEDNLAKLLSSRALYCAITKDLTIVRFKSDELEKIKFQFDSDDNQTKANVQLDGASFDDLDAFEMHYLTEIVGEYAMRDFFFRNGKELADQYDYFIFAPITVNVVNKKKWDLLVYPTIKVEDNEAVLVEFHWFPNDEEISVDSFDDMVLRASTPLSDVKFPIEYISALSLSYDKHTFEKLSFEGGDTFLASVTNIGFRNVVDLASGFLSMLVDYEGSTWFSQNSITLDNSDISESSIRHLLYGLETNATNFRYLPKLNDFSQWRQWHLYVSGGTVLALGNIYELSVPANIISDDLCILNVKILGYMNETNEWSTISELLASKRKMLELRYSINHKYNSIMMFRDIMNYAATSLFNMDRSIEDITELINTLLEEADVAANTRNKILQNALAFLSLLLSTSAVFEYILTPVYTLISGGKEMNPIVQISIYLSMLIVFTLAFLILWAIIKFAKRNKTH